jgi:hypothetical protein
VRTHGSVPESALRGPMARPQAEAPGHASHWCARQLDRQP